MKHFLKKLIILLSSAFLLGFISCSNLFQKINDTQIGYISIGNTTCARSSVVPQSDDVLRSKLTNISLQCVWENNTSNPVVITGDTWDIFYSKFPYALQTGSYSFTLEAKLEGVLFQATKTDSITTSTTTPLSFILKPATNGAPGGLNITWNLTGSPATAIVTLSGSSTDMQTYNSFTNNKLVYTKSNLTAGEYDLTVDFKSSNDSLPVLSTWSGKVRVASGITTTAEIPWTIDSTTYTIEWNLNGGEITDTSYVQATVYARKSETIMLPSSTVMYKEGYHFEGWYDNAGFTGNTITSIPKNSTGNKSINALFSPNTNTPYKVNHWKQKLDATGTTHDETNYILDEEHDIEEFTGITDTTVTPVAKEITGTFFGFTAPTSSQLTEAAAQILPNGSTEINLYYDRQTHTVTYKDGVDNTISVPPAVTYRYGANVNVDFTTLVARSGYYFDSWKDLDANIEYVNGGPDTSFTMGVSDIELTAQWSEFFVTINDGDNTTNYSTINDAYTAIYGSYSGKDIIVTLSGSLTTDDIGKANDGGYSIAHGINATNANSVSLIVPEGQNLTLDYSDCSYMFKQCTKLASADFKGMKLGSSVREIYGMFYGCTNLTYVDLSGFDTTNITSIMCMFEQCSNLQTVDLSTFNTANVTSLHALFNNCRSLTSVNLTGMDTSKADSFTDMFHGCRSLTTLDISSFKVRNNSINGLDMFNGCTQLETIYVSKDFDLSFMSSTAAAGMFTDCTSLVGKNGTSFETEQSTDATFARPDLPGSQGYFSLVGDQLAPTSIGDIVFKDGSVRAYNNTPLTAKEKESAVAIIFYVGDELNNGSDTTTRILGLGLHKNPTPSTWGIPQTNAGGSYYSDTLSATLESGSACDSVFTAESYKNGKNMLADIAADLLAKGKSDDTDDPTHYPHFYYAINYKDIDRNVAGTSYETDWYLPTVPELCALGKAYKYNNFGSILEAVCDSDFLGDQTFWSSSITEQLNGNKNSVTFSTQYGCTYTWESYCNNAYSSVAVHEFN